MGAPPKAGAPQPATREPGAGGGSPASSQANDDGQRHPADSIHEFSFVVRWLDNPRLYCHCEHMSTTKEERLQIRVGPADKALLERAAAASHLNVSAFVVQAAAAKAEEILAERSSIRLTREAAIAFTEALERPAEVNDRLATAMRRQRTFSWLD